MILTIDNTSCFNAFSRVDVRVDVKIPGGVNAYVIDLRGERYIVTSFPCSPILQPEFYADTKRQRISGKKPMYLHYSVLFCTQTTPHTGSKHIVNWTPSPLPTVTSGSSKLQKCFS